MKISYHATIAQKMMGIGVQSTAADQANPAPLLRITLHHVSSP